MKFLGPPRARVRYVAAPDLTVDESLVLAVVLLAASLVIAFF
jgi:hypothetical protein